MFFSSAYFVRYCMRYTRCRLDFAAIFFLQKYFKPNSSIWHLLGTQVCLQTDGYRNGRETWDESENYTESHQLIAQAKMYWICTVRCVCVRAREQKNRVFHILHIHLTQFGEFILYIAVFRCVAIQICLLNCKRFNAMKNLMCSNVSPPCLRATLVVLFFVGLTGYGLHATIICVWKRVLSTDKCVCFEIFGFFLFSTDE